MNIGVLSLQGSVIEHINTLNKLKGVKALEVKYTQVLNTCDGIILPGGESTTMGKLLRAFNLLEPLKDRIKQGMPVWGTCAGMVLLAGEIVGEQPHLGLMDITVRRNAFGSQLFSFSKEYYIEALKRKFETVFIRAPWIERIGKGVESLLEIDGHVVAAKQSNMLVTSFHPELTEDTTFHKYFVSLCK